MLVGAKKKRDRMLMVEGQWCMVESGMATALMPWSKKRGQGDRGKVRVDQEHYEAHSDHC